MTSARAKKINERAVGIPSWGLGMINARFTFFVVVGFFGTFLGTTQAVSVLGS